MRQAVVTGSSRGIGAAISRKLLKDGWRVIGLDRLPPSVEDEGFTPHTLDLTDARARAEVLQKITDVNALVHSAGVMRVGLLGALDLAAGEELWRIHVEAATALADNLVPRMKQGGRVVLIGSRVAQGTANRSQYAAVKSALSGLARSWAKEHVSDGITVNIVSPAATDTSLLADPARSKEPPKLPPMGRLIRPEEVAAMVAFLLAEEAAAITGQEILICGGASL